MKQGTFLTKTVIWLFFFAIVAYLGVNLANGLLHPLKTELVYALSVDRGVSVSGVFVRDELPIALDASLVDVLPSEGERIGKGQVLAKIYSDQDTLQRERDKAEIDRQLEQLSYFGGTYGLDISGKELDEKISDSLAALRGMAAQKRLTNLEKTAQNLKNLIFQRDYVYYGADGIEKMTAALRERRAALERMGSGNYTVVYAPEAGTYSALVDGLEERLNPETVKELTPSGLEALMRAETGEAKSGYVGKIIRGSKWYFAFLIEVQNGKEIKAGNKIRLKFEREFSADLAMQVEHVSKTEGGKLLVLASCTRNLSETTLLREQNAQLVQTSSAGLRIPKEAVRVEEDGKIGVYCLSGLQAKFKPVTILFEGESFYLVEYDRGNAAAIREGDLVIVAGEGLYDGKVVA